VNSSDHFGYNNIWPYHPITSIAVFTHAAAITTMAATYKLSPFVVVFALSVEGFAFLYQYFERLIIRETN
jgi:hypothetical protein